MGNEVSSPESDSERMTTFVEEGGQLLRNKFQQLRQPAPLSQKQDEELAAYRKKYGSPVKAKDFLVYSTTEHVNVLYVKDRYAITPNNKKRHLYLLMRSDTPIYKFIIKFASFNRTTNRSTLQRYIVGKDGNAYYTDRESSDEDDSSSSSSSDSDSDDGGNSDANDESRYANNNSVSSWTTTSIHLQPPNRDRIELEEYRSVDNSPLIQQLQERGKTSLTSRFEMNSTTSSNDNQPSWFITRHIWLIDAYNVYKNANLAEIGGDDKRTPEIIQAEIERCKLLNECKIALTRLTKSYEVRKKEIKMNHKREMNKKGGDSMIGAVVNWIDYQTSELESSDDEQDKESNSSLLSDISVSIHQQPQPPPVSVMDIIGDTGESMTLEEMKRLIRELDKSLQQLGSEQPLHIERNNNNRS